MHEFILIEAVKIKARQRKEMDKEKFAALAESIRTDGLLHAPVLDIDDTLLVGERRFRAMQQLHADGIMFRYAGRPVPKGKIPFTRNYASDELHLREIELAENVFREDLSWPDRVQAMAEIHRLKSAKNPEQTYTKTAQEITAAKGSGVPSVIAKEVSRSLLTVDFLDKPEVKNARNEKEAFNAACRILRQEFASKLSTKKSDHIFIEGDAQLECDTLAADGKRYTCFILDPPYGIDAQGFVNKTKTEHSYDDSPEYAMELNRALIQKCFQLGAENAHLWLFCDVDHWLTLRTIATEAGWLVFPTPVVWNSGVRGHVPNQTIGIRRNHEFLMFMMKGNKGLSQIFDDVINGIPGGTIEYHAAEKPRRLYELLLSLSAVAGDHVLDPCCGSGTIFRAAATKNLHATGIEKNPEYAAFCRSVITELSQATPTAAPSPPMTKPKAAVDDLEDF